jgi:hypothetical protein
MADEDIKAPNLAMEPPQELVRKGLGLTSIAGRDAGACRHRVLVYQLDRQQTLPR